MGEVIRMTDGDGATIGLKRHTVELVAHQPGWADLAAAACQRVRDIGGDLVDDVQHVGSTAVPDLPAKPILDLAAAVATLDVMSELTRRLVADGYVYRGDKGAAGGGHLFVLEPTPDVRVMHLHVVLHAGAQWRSYLRFRDLLRRDARLRQRYANLKAELRARFPEDRRAYSAAKDEFIRGAMSGDA